MSNLIEPQSVESSFKRPSILFRYGTPLKTFIIFTSLSFLSLELWRIRLLRARNKIEGERLIDDLERELEVARAVVIK